MSTPFLFFDAYQTKGEGMRLQQIQKGKQRNGGGAGGHSPRQTIQYGRLQVTGGQDGVPLKRSRRHGRPQEEQDLLDEIDKLTA